MTDARPTTDGAARRRIVEDLDTTLFVEAAAGTGKTTALVARIITLLRAGRTTLERLVAVTFTEKAAGELKLRLRTEIERVRIDPTTPEDERVRFERALGQLEVARIGTIHAFCADLLRERPVEAGVDPRFSVAPEDESERLLDEAFDRWFEGVLADPPAGVRRVLRRRPQRRDLPGPRVRLRRAASTLVGHRDFPAPWRRVPFEREARIDALVARLGELARLADLAHDPQDWLAQNLAQVARFVRDNAAREAVRGRDHDALEAELCELTRAGWHWRGWGEYGPELERSEVFAQRDAVHRELVALVAEADADLAALLREDLRPVVEGYRRLLAREGKLDFLDLLQRARDLIREDATVRREAQERFTHFLVDEFQDTDPLQVDLLLLLAADDPQETDPARARPLAGKLFLVGDPKQSIYRFRRADVALYERTKRRLVESAGAVVVDLSTSFRAVPDLQQAINAAFAPHFVGGEAGTQARYVALEGWRAASGERPALVALPVPRPYSDWGRVTKWSIEDCLPDAVAAFVEWLVQESGWTVTERDDPERPVPLRPHHVCLLFRRFRNAFEDVTGPYVRALEVRRIPHVLVGGRSFHKREEVLALRNALAAIEWPDDALHVFATLRGPLFALGDDALLAFRTRSGTLHPLQPLDRAGLEPAEREVADALSILADLHRGRNRRPVAVTLTRLLEATRAHAGFANWPTGEQALANALRLVERAQRFEHRGAPSFRAFVERIDEEAESGEAAEAPVVEEGTEGVRIMTVHRAKGLEFPVVVLADPTCRASRETPQQHVDVERGLWAEPLCGATPHDVLDHRPEEARREREEAVRVAYVAATRARDLLVVPVVGDAGGEAEPEDWCDFLYPALYPAGDARRRPLVAPGCPAFGGDSVLERPPKVRIGAASSVAPGLHTARAGNPVVWWDPAILALEREEDVGLRQRYLLDPPAAGAEVDEGVAAHEAWRAERERRLARGGVPALILRRVTALAAERAERAEGEAEVAVAPVEVVHVVRGVGLRPGGIRFGSLVHSILAAVDLDAGDDALGRIAAMQGRLLGAAPEEIDAARALVTTALAHPLLRQAARRPSLRRETPVVMRVEDGSLVEGVVDLAFRDDAGGWVVVDFKTDREIDGRRPIYAEQVGLYARAITAATGEPARGVLLVL